MWCRYCDQECTSFSAVRMSTYREDLLNVGVNVFFRIAIISAPKPLRSKPFILLCPLDFHVCPRSVASVQIIFSRPATFAFPFDFRSTH